MWLPRRLVAVVESTDARAIRLRRRDYRGGVPIAVVVPLEQLHERELGAIGRPTGCESGQPRADARHAAAIRAHEHDLVRSVTRGRERQRRAVGLPGRAIVAGRIVRKPCETGIVCAHPAAVVIAGGHRAAESTPGPSERPGPPSHEPYALR